MQEGKENTENKTQTRIYLYRPVTVNAVSLALNSTERQRYGSSVSPPGVLKFCVHMLYAFQVKFAQQSPHVV